MRPYEQDGVVYLSLYKFYDSGRRRLIREWKNPLLQLGPEAFAKEKYDLAVALRATPGNTELRIKWDLLREIENG